MMNEHYATGQLIGLTAVDRNDAKVGRIADVYADDTTGQPEWLAVETGFFGTKLNFVPLTGAEVYGDTVYIGYDRDLIKDAPRIDAEGHLEPDEESALYAHYGINGGDGTGTRGGDGYDVSGPSSVSRPAPGRRAAPGFASGSRPRT